MWEIPPGPDWERLRRDVPDVEDALRRGPSFPVYEVREPRLGAGALAGAGSAGDLWQVGLRWGEPLSRSGPMLSAWTARVPPDEEGGPVEPELEEVLADERDRLYDDAGIDEPQPQSVEEISATLVIDDIPVSAVVRREDDLWAARVVLSREGRDGQPVDVMVTVMGRGVSLDAVRLAPAGYVAPYLAGREEREARLVQQLALVADPAREKLELSAARGVEAHLALIEDCVADADASRRAVREGRRHREPRGAAEQQGRLWEAAVRAQMRLATQTRDEADEAVGSLVNHMTELSEAADWFGDPALRQPAIDESVRYVIFDSDVPSRPAQQAWQRSWDRRRRPSFLDPPAQEEAREIAASIERDHAELLNAWRRWINERQ